MDSLTFAMTFPLIRFEMTAIDLNEFGMNIHCTIKGSEELIPASILSSEEFAFRSDQIKKSKAVTTKFIMHHCTWLFTDRNMQ
jgi:hypothetical protein